MPISKPRLQDRELAIMRNVSTNPDHYLKRGVRTVDGWLQTGAARLIVETGNVQSQFGVRGHMAEIGVHEGKLFILLCLLRNPDEEAVGIDVFDRQDLNRDRSGRGSRDRLEKNLRRLAAHGKQAILISCDSRNLSADNLLRTVGGPFRIFSIDGGHEAGTVFHDLEVAAGTLCDGGVIVLDDYFNEGWPGVADGTNRLFGSGHYPELVPFAIAQNKLLIGQRGYAERYRTALVARFKEKTKIRESTLFGNSVCYFDFGFSRFTLFMMEAFGNLAGQRPGLHRFLRRFRDSM
jgi:Methyltransferase domain